MANIAIFRINYKSDFILTLNSDAGWMTPFCIKFWTGAPSQAYFAGYDGETYTHCAPVDGEPTKLLVQFDDHHLPIGDLKFQIGYHFTVADFPTSVEDEVLNQASVTIEVNDAPAQVMLDLNGETAPEIEFSLPSYANEAQRIANEEDRIAAEQQRIANEDARIDAEETRQQNEQQRINQETARVNEFATLKSQSQAATRNANDAATLANQKAQLAADKAALADDAATLAIQKAQLAADKAALANDAAQLANEKAALAQQKAEYAQQQGGYAKDQGDYAKDQGDYAKAQGDIAQSDHERAETDHGIAANDHTQAGNDHTRAESDHGIAANDHTQAGNDHTRAESDHGIAANDHTQAGNDHTRAESDHGIAADDHTQAGNDHTRAESDHTRAESDHAAVEVYVDSLGAFDISAYHATGGVLAKYADLTAALGTNGANIPEALRKGGMSVKFVQGTAQSSDNKYVQFRYMSSSTAAADFTNVANWQGVDDEPTAGSDNLVKSGGISKLLLNNVCIGNDNTQVGFDYYGLKPGNTYILVPAQTTWDIAGVTLGDGNSVFQLSYINQDDTISRFLNVKIRNFVEDGGIQNSYKFTIPDDKKGIINLLCRATLGTELMFSLYDITYVDELNNNTRTSLNNIINDINKTLDPIAIDFCGTAQYSFPITPNSHSSVNDRFNLDVKAGVTINLEYALGNGAQMTDTSNRKVQLMIAYKDGTTSSIICPLEDDDTGSYEYTFAKDVTSIGFYIYKITNPGTFDVTLNIDSYVKKRLDDIEDLYKIPSYFTTQVNQVIEDATKDIADAGHDGNNFIFITDMHWEVNYKNSPKLINYICKNLYIDSVVFGGDAINGRADQQVARQFFREISNGLRAGGSNLISVVGNHDYNSTGQGVIFDNKEQTFYSLLQKPSDYHITENTGKGYFYIDNVACNTRFIVLNSGMNYTIDNDQQTWFDDVMSRTPSDRHIIIFIHVYLRERGQYDEGTFIGYNYEISNSGNTINTVLNNYVETKQIEAIIAGHAHLDANGVTDNMIPVVVSMCDARSTHQFPSTQDTINEQGFDVITVNYDSKTITCRRVGRGKSRIIHYDVKTLNVGDTLDISSLISITPTSYSLRDNFSLQYRVDSGVTFNPSVLGSISSLGVVTASAVGKTVAVAENDDFIETFDIKIS